MLSIAFIRKSSQVAIPAISHISVLTPNSEMLVANYFPKMMSKAAGFLQTQMPAQAPSGRRRTSGSGQQVRSLLD